ncbi:MAG TPA: diguanylate cyclase response regulator [Lentisphaeria bacterium]|nr:MAG: diguanylate cyclase response regulator [Lentisphaerae bacterium GWF2_50_93]HCE44853.1 diguanylate cyclase response regulator [Lentisphaeria bacterium]
MKILIAEDDAVSKRMIESTLARWGFEVISTTDGMQAWEIISSASPPEIVILDWVMPGMEGVEICRRIRKLEVGSERYTFIILLTAKSELKDIVAGMESGADDYVSKPFDPQELGLRIRAGKRIIELHNQLRRAKEELLVLSRTDSLTGMLNRRAFYEVLEKEIVRSCRQKIPLSMIMLDIDHFKKINDTYGHQEGDAVLRELSSRIGSAIRHYDVMSRYGGEEFIALLPGVDVDAAANTAERFRELIGKTPFESGKKRINVTISLGVAQLVKDEKSDVLIGRADEALYKAKQNGRNGVEICSS